MAKGKGKHKHHEEHIDETWLIPYADLLTLLLALFIVLFASSQVDAKKLGDMAQVFQAVFTGNTGVLTNPSAAVNPPVPQPPSSKALSVDARQETIQLLELKKNVDKYIADNGLTNDLETQLTGDGLMIIIGEVALFPSGSAELLPAAKNLVHEIGKLLVEHPQKVTIAGHTDNVPINTAEFPSNWDLSSKRALNFMKLILTNTQLKPERFNATGYGEYRPVAINNSIEGRAKNRRVEVMIQRIHKE